MNSRSPIPACGCTRSRKSEIPTVGDNDLRTISRIGRVRCGMIDLEQPPSSCHLVRCQQHLVLLFYSIFLFFGAAKEHRDLATRFDSGEVQFGAGRRRTGSTGSKKRVGDVEPERIVLKTTGGDERPGAPQERLPPRPTKAGPLHRNQRRRPPRWPWRAKVPGTRVNGCRRRPIIETAVGATRGFGPAGLSGGPFHSVRDVLGLPRGGLDCLRRVRSRLCGRGVGHFPVLLPRGGHPLAVVRVVLLGGFSLQL